jgi:hypothetical protein
MRSTFAIYIIEDEEGELRVRADSFGQGTKALNLGLDVLRDMICTNENSGGDVVFMLPIDRSEHIQ